VVCVRPFPPSLSLTPSLSLSLPSFVGASGMVDEDDDGGGGGGTGPFEQGPVTH
jgi:hypothetical protein